MAHHSILNPSTYKRGVYETLYANAAYVSGAKAKTAFDLDMCERIPLSEVTRKWLRSARDEDVPRRTGSWF